MTDAWVLIRGGLGNQMFQVAYGTVLAQRYGVAVRYVDFSQDARVQRDWGLSVFGLPRHALSSVTWHALRYGVIAARRLEQSTGLTTPFGINLEPLDGSCVKWPVRAPWLSDGYWQQASYYLDVLPLLRERFRVDLGPHAQQLQALRAMGRPIVAMHARRGDYVSDPAAAMHLVCDVAYYRRAWANIKEQVPQAMLWVFSDDLAWARANLNLEPDTQFALGTPQQPAWVDMMRMASCDHFIISNSSYSWWAAMLASGSGKLVVAPSHWLVGKPTLGSGMCPDEWLLM